MEKQLWGWLSTQKADVSGICWIFGFFCVWEKNGDIGSVTTAPLQVAATFEVFFSACLKICLQ